MTEIKNTSNNKLIIDNQKESTSRIHDKNVSTFSDSHVNKNSLIQSYMEMELERVIGNYFVFDNLEYQEAPDYNDSNKINKATIYAVKVISKKAALPFGSIINVKVKDTEPLFAEHEIENITLGLQKPIVLTFENLAHYHFNNGETINATAVHKASINIKEASEL